jgi:hypothetical protein
MVEIEIGVLRGQRENGPSSHVFLTERGGPITPKSFHGLFARNPRQAPRLVSHRERHSLSPIFLRLPLHCLTSRILAFEPVA